MIKQSLALVDLYVDCGDPFADDRFADDGCPHHNDLGPDLTNESDDGADSAVSLC